MPATTYTARRFDAGLVQHRVECGGLVAVALAPMGARPALWNVSRLSSRGVRWSVARVGLGDVRKMTAPGARRLAGVLRAVEHGRLAA